MARRTVVFAAAASVAIVNIPSTDGYASYVALLPNGGAFPDAPAIGHPDAEGIGGLNQFGEGWNKLGKAWTKAYCQADSDGDGFTNGQELGDPCCTWTPTNPAGLITEGISHPSEKTKTPTNPKLQTKCATGGGTSGGAGGGASNSTAGGGGTAGNTDVGPGTVAPSDGIPEDDDEDDSDESATLAPKENTAQRPRGAVIVATLSAVLSAVAFMW